MIAPMPTRRDPTELGEREIRSPLLDLDGAGPEPLEDALGAGDGAGAIGAALDIPGLLEGLAAGVETAGVETAGVETAGVETAAPEEVAGVEPYVTAGAVTWYPSLAQADSIC